MDPEKTTVTEEHREDAAEADTSDATRTASEAESAEDESKYPKGFPLVALTLGLCGTTFLIALDNTIIATGTSTNTYDMCTKLSRVSYPQNHFGTFPEGFR
jgi:hypothetical protein